jgi:hypothetical protein
MFFKSTLPSVFIETYSNRVPVSVARMERAKPVIGQVESRRNS